MLVIITDRGSLGTALSKGLSERGLFLYRCPLQTALFTCEKKDTGGVLLDLVPNQKAGEAVCRELRARYPEMPIAVLAKDGGTPPDVEADCILREEPPEALARVVWEFYCKTCGWRDAPMATYRIKVTACPEETLYMGYPLPLTPTEHRILRCLLYRAPKLTSADDLMMLCFPEGRQRIANLAVHVRNINQKARRIDPRPLIESVYGKGYRLREWL